MNITEADRAAGFKEIRVAMLDGKFEVVSVCAPTPENMVEMMSQKMSAKTVYSFIKLVTGKDLQFILRIAPESFSEIFITASGLMGAEHLAREAAIQAGLQMIQKASGHGT